MAAKTPSPVTCRSERHNSSASTFGSAIGVDYRSTPYTMVGLALAGGGIELWLVGRPRQRTRRNVPVGRLQLDACQCGLCLGCARLRLGSRVDRPSCDRSGQRRTSPPVSPPTTSPVGLRAAIGSPFRASLPCRGSGSLPTPHCRCSTSARRPTGDRRLRLVDFRACLQRADDDHDPDRARRLVRREHRARQRRDPVAAYPCCLGVRSLVRHEHDCRVPVAAWIEFQRDRRCAGATIPCSPRPPRRSVSRMGSRWLGEFDSELSENSRTYSGFVRLRYIW